MQGKLKTVGENWKQEYNIVGETEGENPKKRNKEIQVVKTKKTREWRAEKKLGKNKRESNARDVTSMDTRLRKTKKEESEPGKTKS